MILADQHKLAYRDSLSTFFPEFPRYAKEITVADLLHHTAGLPEYGKVLIDMGLIDEDWPRSIDSRRSSYEPTSRDVVHILARQPELQFFPGEKFCYSNSAYVVLSQIVERVSGQRFPEFVKNEIFEPLGMYGSLVYDESRPKVRKRAVSYSGRAELMSAWTIRRSTSSTERMVFTPLSTTW